MPLSGFLHNPEASFKELPFEPVVMEVDKIYPCLPNQRVRDQLVVGAEDPLFFSINPRRNWNMTFGRLRRTAEDSLPAAASPRAHAAPQLSPLPATHAVEAKGVRGSLPILHTETARARAETEAECATRNVLTVTFGSILEADLSSYDAAAAKAGPASLFIVRTQVASIGEGAGEEGSQEAAEGAASAQAGANVPQQTKQTMAGAEWERAAGEETAIGSTRPDESEWYVLANQRSFTVEDELWSERQLQPPKERAAWLWLTSLSDFPTYRSHGANLIEGGADTMLLQQLWESPSSLLLQAAATRPLPRPLPRSLPRPPAASRPR